MKYVQTLKAARELIRLGLLPPRTTTFEILADFEKPAKLRVESYLTDTQYAQFLEVFLREAEAKTVTTHD